MPSDRIQLAALLLAVGLYNGLLYWFLQLAGNVESSSGPIWTFGLYAVPMGLAAGLLAGHRWPFLASIVYATVGLALDIATLVYGLTHEAALSQLLIATGPTGCLNFEAIVVGGSGMFQTIAGTKLRGDRLPNPLSRPSR